MIIKMDVHNISVPNSTKTHIILIQQFTFQQAFLSRLLKKEKGINHE